MLQKNAIALDSDISSDSENEKEARSTLNQSEIGKGNDDGDEQDSLAEIYEFLHKKQNDLVKKKTELGMIKEIQAGEKSHEKQGKVKKYGNIKSRVFDHLSTSQGDTAQESSVARDAKLSSSKLKYKPSNILTERSHQLEKTIQRLNAKPRKIEAGESNPQLRLDPLEERELTFKPQLNRRSISLAKKKRQNQVSYKDIHERLFYQGLEEEKNKLEKAENDFQRYYPFSPNLPEKPDNSRGFSRSKS